MTRPILVGMLNPYTMDPKLALAPIGPNTAGMRLFRVLTDRVPCSRHDYKARFERVNLCFGEWCNAKAKKKAAELEASWRERYVVLLGSKVREAFGFKPLPLAPLERGSNTFFQIPHPSGKCLWYNDERNRARAADLLAQLYRTDRETYDHDERVQL